MQLQWVRQELAGLDLSPYELTNGILTDCTLTGVTLRQADLSYMLLVGCVFTECDLAGSNFLKSDLRYAKFIWSNLQNASLLRTEQRETEYHNVNLQSSNFHSVSLFGCRFVDSDLRGTALTRVALKDVIFQNVDLRGAIDAEQTRLGRANVMQDGNAHWLEGDALRRWLVAEVAKP